MGLPQSRCSGKACSYIYICLAGMDLTKGRKVQAKKAPVKDCNFPLEWSRQPERADQERMLQRITYLHQDGCFQAQRAPAGGVSECPPISSWVALYCDITRVLQWLLSAHGPSGKASSGCPIILFHLKGDSADDTVKIRQGHIKKLSQVLYCTAQHRTAHLTNIF